MDTFGNQTLSPSILFSEVSLCLVHCLLFHPPPSTVCLLTLVVSLASRVFSLFSFSFNLYYCFYMESPRLIRIEEANLKVVIGGFITIYTIVIENINTCSRPVLDLNVLYLLINIYLTMKLTLSYKVWTGSKSVTHEGPWAKYSSTQTQPYLNNSATIYKN